MIKRIHVNQHVIKSNRKNGTDDPPLTIKTSRQNYKARHVAIDGPSELVYSHEKPLNCGARLWIETTSEVILDGEARIN